MVARVVHIAFDAIFFRGTERECRHPGNSLQGWELTRDGKTDGELPTPCFVSIFLALRAIVDTFDRCWPRIIAVHVMFSVFVEEITVRKKDTEMKIF